MSIKMQRGILIVALAVGTVLNILCLINVIPINYNNISFMIVNVIALLIVITNLFIPFLPKERSAYIRDLTTAEKVQACIIVVLIVAWAITAIVCVIRL
jgi:hypothetical protein